MMPITTTTIIAPIRAGTNEKPATIGPHVPNKSGPIHAPMKPATIAPAQLPGILKGDILSATVPMISAIIAERIKLITLI
jgi:hypothetical protein